ncbi:MAG: endolytic transglycosylase MltG [Gudongella sp.]|nr:endolytic transglycosylase MltG [Gudongella sp.]
MKKLILVLVLLILIAGVGAFFFLPGYLNETFNENEEILIVESGDSLGIVSSKLYNDGVIKSKYWFRYNGKDIATKIKPGKYTIKKNSTIQDIYEIIQQGEIDVPIVVTFPEGFILYQFASKLEESGISSLDEFIEATEEYYNANLSSNYSNEEIYFSMEGYLFPETYYFSNKQTIEEIVNTLYKTGADVWDEDMLVKLSQSEYNKHQILTIASLIEREAYNDEERAKISGVIYNRLRLGMPLQIDATVIYGIGEGKEHMTRVLYEDLEKDNPYNTYRNKGIPVGPIANPGKNSIYASLFPEEHEYLYYVMGENGHVFAKTYAEHLINVENYRKTQ